MKQCQTLDPLENKKMPGVAPPTFLQVSSQGQFPHLAWRKQSNKCCDSGELRNQRSEFKAAKIPGMKLLCRAPEKGLLDHWNLVKRNDVHQLLIRISAQITLLFNQGISLRHLLSLHPIVGNDLGTGLKNV